MQDSIDTALSPPAPAGWGDLFSGGNAMPMLVLAGGVTLYSVNMYIAITVMPSVVREIGGLDFYAWTMTLFVVGSILGAALAANLLRQWGPRGAYFIASVLFAAGTLTCAMAPTMSVMLIGRTLQGLGGGFLYALAYALTRIVLPERVWGRAIGLISAVFGIATLIGPAIGGIFADGGSWRTAFWSLMPFAVGFALLALFAFPRRSSDRNERAPVPVLQLILLTLAVLAVSAGGLSSETQWAAAGLIGALVLIVLIARTDAIASARLLPRRSFRFSSALAPLYLSVALLMLSMQPEIYVPYMLQQLHGQTPLWAGYLAAMMSMGWTLGSLLSSRRQSGGKGMLTIGPALTFIGLVILAICLPVQGNGSWMWLGPICLALVLVGLGIGIAWPNLVTEVYRSAPADEQDLATGGMTTVQLFAIAMGTALAGMISNTAGIGTPGGVEGAASAAFWVCALFALAPAIGVLVAAHIQGRS